MCRSPDRAFPGRPAGSGAQAPGLPGGGGAKAPGGLTISAQSAGGGKPPEGRSLRSRPAKPVGLPPERNGAPAAPAPHKQKKGRSQPTRRPYVKTYLRASQRKGKSVFSLSIRFCDTKVALLLQSCKFLSDSFRAPARGVFIHKTTRLDISEQSGLFFAGFYFHNRPRISGSKTTESGIYGHGKRLYPHEVFSRGLVDF